VAEKCPSWRGPTKRETFARLARLVVRLRSGGRTGDDLTVGQSKASAMPRTCDAPVYILSILEGSASVGATCRKAVPALAVADHENFLETSLKVMASTLRSSGTLVDVLRRLS
jgi:hypothetical protein